MLTLVKFLASLLRNSSVVDCHLARNATRVQSAFLQTSNFGKLKKKIFHIIRPFQIQVQFLVTEKYEKSKFYLF